MRRCCASLLLDQPAGDALRGALDPAAVADRPAVGACVHLALATLEGCDGDEFRAALASRPSLEAAARAYRAPGQ